MLQLIHNVHNNHHHNSLCAVDVFFPEYCLCNFAMSSSVGTYN